MLSTWRVVWGIVSWCYWVRAASNTLASSTAITFGGVKFSPPVATALQRLGIHDKPSPIQSAAIPLICSGLSCIVHAPTGSGKTFAFALPALKRLAIPNEADNNGKVVIISPTEELALQINHDVETLSGDPTLSALCNSKTKKGPLFRKLQTSSLLIGTAQYILDYLRSNDGQQTLKNLCYLVLDEVDRLVPVKNRYTGISPDSSQTLTADIFRLLVQHEKKLQVVAVSSTVGRPLHRSLFRMISPLISSSASNGIDDDNQMTTVFPIIRPHDLQTMTMRSAVEHDVSRTPSHTTAGMVEKTTQPKHDARLPTSRYVSVPNHIEHIVLPGPSDITMAKRLGMITNSMRSSSLSTHRTLIFVPTPADATQCRNILKFWKVPDVYSIKEAKTILKGSAVSDLPQNMTIVSSMSVARGLHLPGITTVFVSHPPSTMDEYLHVAGRTGRLECIYTSHQSSPVTESPSVVTVANPEELKRMLSWQTPLGIDLQFG